MSFAPRYRAAGKLHSVPEKSPKNRYPFHQQPPPTRHRPSVSPPRRHYVYLDCDRQFDRKQIATSSETQHKPLLRTNSASVSFGSLAALRPHFSPTADSGGKAVVRPTIFFTKILNVCFHQKRSFDVPKIRDIVRLLSATRRRSRVRVVGLV